MFQKLKSVVVLLKRPLISHHPFINLSTAVNIIFPTIISVTAISLYSNKNLFKSFGEIEDIT